MGRHGAKRLNPFAQRKRDKKNVTGKPNRRDEAYNEIVRENENFCKYYKAQNICPVDEWDEFLATMKSNLPTTFRVTGNRERASALLEIIQNELFQDYQKAVSELHQLDGSEVRMPESLPWYPNSLAWQLNLSRNNIRRSELFFKLHNFLICETSAGSISRQEAVSMIPPLVLDVKPHDKVLDMCAAPGSKTAQLIEALHADGEDKLPAGFIVANDVDNNRCYMLVHQAKRLNSPCFVVTNHDSCFLPNLLTTNADGKQEKLKFTKILCDVPCSGDGTLRKHPDIWQRWNSAQGNNLHGMQYRITRRGAELLEVGGRLVYSTCSLNPIENEAVLQRIIKDAEGALEIVDSSHLVPGLKYRPGFTQWKVSSKDIEIFDSFEPVPEKYHTVIRPTMFPLPENEIKSIGLDKCMRILPHFQDSGAFFVATIQKIKKLPWEKDDIDEKTASDEKTDSEEKTEETQSGSANGDDKSVPWGPQRKKLRIQGFKEDPYVFFGENEEVWNSIKEFYDLSDTFNSRCLLTRCVAGKKKNIYFCSEAIKDLVQLNEDSVKIINTGVRMFSRCDNKNMKCAFRLVQEGLQTSNPFIGEKRRIVLQRDDLIKILHCIDPTKPPPLTDLSEETQQRAAEIDPGSCILKYQNEKLSLFVVGWRGTHSLRAYIENSDTAHFLRLLGADLSMFEINKFKKTEEMTVQSEAASSSSAAQVVAVDEIIEIEDDIIEIHDDDTESLKSEDNT